MTAAERRQWLLSYAASAAGWLALALFFASEGVLGDRYRGRPVDWQGTLIYSLQFYGVWALLTPPVLRLATRFSWRAMTPRRFIALHAFVGLTTALLQAAIFVVAFWPRYAGPTGTAMTVLQDMIVSHLHSNLVIYALLVAGVAALDAYRRLRERELQAARLHGELARASLAALRLQLQPHFLFNTLNGITALVAEEPDKAERMIAQLAALLRRSLDGASADQVPLSRELETLALYLAIERERFGERLRVTMDVAPDCADALVPGMILQPLVENAIRHGIGRRAGPGTVAIAASRDGGCLHLQVHDDGPGMAADQAARNPPSRADAGGTGIGLDNARERLSRLYGDAQRVTLAPIASGGTAVTLTLPFRVGTVPTE
jgi:two-component system, LytTR family, sensor kinase